MFVFGFQISASLVSLFLVFESCQLSYNWGSQPIVLKIANSLKRAGFKVWLDIEQMSGSTLEASNNHFLWDLYLFVFSG